MEKYLPILKSSPFFKGLSDGEILSVLHCVNAATISKMKIPARIAPLFQ